MARRKLSLAIMSLSLLALATESKNAKMIRMREEFESSANTIGMEVDVSGEVTSTNDKVHNEHEENTRLMRMREEFESSVNTIGMEVDVSGEVASTKDKVHNEHEDTGKEKEKENEREGKGMKRRRKKRRKKKMKKEQEEREKAQRQPQPQVKVERQPQLQPKPAPQPATTTTGKGGTTTTTATAAAITTTTWETKPGYGCYFVKDTKFDTLADAKRDCELSRSYGEQCPGVLDTDCLAKNDDNDEHYRASHYKLCKPGNQLYQLQSETCVHTDLPVVAP